MIDPRTFGKVEPIIAERDAAADCDSGGDGGVDGMAVVHKKRLSAAQRKKAKSKPVDVKLEARDDADLRRALDTNALRGYEAFYRLSPGSATLAQVIRSSAGIAGWANFAACLDVVKQDLDADKERFDAETKRGQLLNSMGIIDEVKRTVAKRVPFKGVSRAPSTSWRFWNLLVRATLKSLRPRPGRTLNSKLLWILGRRTTSVTRSTRRAMLL